MVTQQAFGVDPAQDTRTFQVRTYGCQMNVHDSERLAGLLEAAGYRRAEDGLDADVETENPVDLRGPLVEVLVDTVARWDLAVAGRRQVITAGVRCPRSVSARQPSTG